MTTAKFLTSLILNVKLKKKSSIARTPNEGINQRYLKKWADVADKICFGRVTKVVADHGSEFSG